MSQRPIAEQESLLGLQIAVTSGAAVLHAGRVVFAASEERFTKVKNETLFPTNAIREAMAWLDREGLPRPKRAVLVTENMDHLHYATRRECTFSVDDYLREQHQIWKPRLIEGRDVDFAEVFSDKIDAKALSAEQLNRLGRAANPQQEWRWLRDEMARSIEGIEETVWVGHEHAHAAYALYGSGTPVDETLVVTVDGFGDDSNATIWIHDRGRLRRLASYDQFNVGRIYRSMTLLLGMKPNEHEYKVMGLAPHGKDPWAERAYRVFADTWMFDESSGEVRSEQPPRDCYFHFRDRLEGMRFDAIAAGLQRYTEEMLVRLARYWVRRTGRRRVVLAGGVALNVKANLALSEAHEVDSVHVPPSPGDESLCIGAPMAYLDEIGASSCIHPIEHAWLGSEWGAREVDAAIRRHLSHAPEFGLTPVGDDVVAALLEQGFIIGRFAERMEFGARSLGNRAILASPIDPDVVRRINATVKHRDFWMPFTPSILEENASDYLRDPDVTALRFMTLACRTTSRARAEIPATLHAADATARPQVVSRRQAPAYWSLINAFKQRTGVGALLNTSLNLSGLPICESPEDAIHVLRNSSLDAILFDRSLVYRRTPALERQLRDSRRPAAAGT